MPLSPEQEWTLVACALVAYADGVVEPGEWDRVLWMLGERLRDDDATAWEQRLGHVDNLRAHLDTLLPPPPFFAEPILEKAWRMALADGEAGDAEIVVHDDLAQRLGMPRQQVEPLRRKWLEQAQRRSVLVAGFAEILAHLDGQLNPEEAEQLDALVERLPMTPQQRETARAGKNTPPSLDDLVASLMAMDAEERGIAMLALVPIVKASAQGERESALFIEVATRVAISEDDAHRMLAE